MLFEVGVGKGGCDQCTVFDAERLHVRRVDQRRREDIHIHINIQVQSDARDGDVLDLVAVGIVDLIGRVEIIVNRPVNARLGHEEVPYVHEAAGVVADFAGFSGGGCECQRANKRENGFCLCLHNSVQMKADFRISEKDYSKNKKLNFIALTARSRTRARLSGFGEWRQSRAGIVEAIPVTISA